jgi:hypothetical protein
MVGDGETVGTGVRVGVGVNVTLGAMVGAEVNVVKAVGAGP